MRVMSTKKVLLGSHRRVCTLRCINKFLDLMRPSVCLMIYYLFNACRSQISLYGLYILRAAHFGRIMASDKNRSVWWSQPRAIYSLIGVRTWVLKMKFTRITSLLIAFLASRVRFLLYHLQHLHIIPIISSYLWVMWLDFNEHARVPNFQRKSAEQQLAKITHFNDFTLNRFETLYIAS